MSDEDKQTVVERESRARLQPQPGDPLYLPLSDLLISLRKAAATDARIVLDYGAGLSPYRPLFPKSEYRAADVGRTAVYANENGKIQTPARHEFFAEPYYTIQPDGTIAEQDATFDFIMSTQVLEHVADAERHLSECFRLLKPGGRLYLSTHGSYEDHGSPYDFRRWTADGLNYDLSKHGFEILSLEKLTTGPRAVMFLLQMYNETMNTPKSTLLGVAHLLFRRGVSRRWLHEQADRAYPQYRVVSADTPGHVVYLCLAALARRRP